MLGPEISEEWHRGRQLLSQENPNLEEVEKIRERWNEIANKHREEVETKTCILRMQPINIETEAADGQKLLSKYISEPKEVERFVSEWRARAEEFNSEFLNPENTNSKSVEDTCERSYVERHRYDPVGLITKIMNDPVTAPRVMEEMGLAESPQHFPASYNFNAVVAMTKNTQGASALFRRLSDALNEKKFGVAQTNRCSVTRLQAIQGWLRPWADRILSTNTPPLCLLDNHGVAHATGLYLRDPEPPLTIQRVSTDIQRWKLPRAPQADRKSMTAFGESWFRRRDKEIVETVIHTLISGGEEGKHFAEYFEYLFSVFRVK